MVYSNEISLAGFLSSLGWTCPEEHVELVLVRRGEDGENDYINIPCNVYNVAKYAYHKVSDIMIEDSKTFSVMIHENY